jgi:dTDP-4-amino-4,6-dideoxygalactose transaminase
MLTNGPLVRDLEAKMAGRLGVAHVVATSSCTSALMLVVQAVVDGRPGPVVMPSFTFSATAHAVAWNGREPRFVEMDPATFQVDPDAFAAALPGAAAAMAVHLYGAPASPALLEGIAAHAEVPLVFDAAHALGATSGERAIGSFGVAEVFSLTPTKVMVAGEGGLVATDDDDLAARLRIGRSYADPGDYDTQFAGMNARMSELHAAVALESLELLDASLAARRALAARYRSALANVAGIAPQVVAPDDRSSYKDFTVSVQAGAFGLTRDELVAVLASEGIDTRNYFDPPVHRQHAYRHVAAPELPVTEAIASGVVSLPIYPDLLPEEQDRIIDVIDDAHRHAEQLRAVLAERGHGAHDPHDRIGR